MFRKEEAAVTDWSPETVAMCARRQEDILEAAAKLLRPGGRLVYSTCTFSPEENEGVVEAFLSRHGEFEPEQLEAPWFAPGPMGSFRLWPHKLLGEGHFAAVLVKTGGEEGLESVQNGEQLPKQWLSFSKELGITLPEGKAVSFGQTLYWAPAELPELKGLRVLRPGLELGEGKQNRFEPAHALALWLDNCGQTEDYPWDSLQIRAYLHGDVLPSEKRGWCLVRSDGYGIGWGKGDGRMLKNHYPKGLRRGR